MLYVPRQPLDTVEDLRVALANAMKLEFSTIPPYLAALYSIKQGANAEIASILRGIVTQEMLHLGFAANILNAVGGAPDFPSIVPTYPGPLPMGIGSEPGKPFIVPIKKMSIETVRDVFMVIEEPEHIQTFPDRLEAVPLEIPEDYRTIGEFYEAVSQLITDLGPTIFTGDEKLQVTGMIGPDELFAITNEAQAKKAIEIIVTQGEGTATTPLGSAHGLAHYYHFEEIVKGKTLSVDPATKQFAWGPPPIPFDPDGVYPMVDNPAHVALPPNTQLARWSQQCDETFSALVNALQKTFAGHPDHLGASIGLMYSLRIQAQQLMATPIPNGAGNAGPRFLYDASTASG